MKVTSFEIIYSSPHNYLLQNETIIRNFQLLYEFIIKLEYSEKAIESELEN